MKKWQTLKEKWLYPTGFTFIIVLACFFLFLEISMPDGTVGLTVRDTFCLLGYSFGITASNFILHMDFGAITRYTVHTAALLVDFIVFVLILTGYISGKGFAAVMISIFYLIGYLIVMLIRGLLLSKKKEQANAKQAYINRFTK